MKHSLFFVSILLLVACKSDPGIEDLRTEEEKQQQEQSWEAESESLPVPEEPEEVSGTQENPKPSTYSYQLIEGEHGWGYQIYDGTTMMINQPHIPSVPGIQGFATKEKAEIAARYVLEQINKGNFPPTVSPEKLKELGAI